MSPEYEKHCELISRVVHTATRQGAFTLGLLSAWAIKANKWPPVEVISAIAQVTSEQEGRDIINAFFEETEGPHIDEDPELGTVV